ncbi:hypothetical protein HGM15179_001652 [Zosterops borbonicus]|uniref:Uncharacterized protein n=1 Tax=Zosterops borbonicus TaxID=364589 RepID=A0A8K1LTZ7_9PASS|nr:hypothetical protein HGM15179_001652 [Zosterops borbonicus]
MPGQAGREGSENTLRRIQGIQVGVFLQPDLSIICSENTLRRIQGIQVGVFLQPDLSIISSKLRNHRIINTMMEGDIKDLVQPCLAKAQSRQHDPEIFPTES